jgi:hypothetical protein
MELSDKQKTRLIFVWGHGLALGAALYFAKAMPTIHPAVYLVLLFTEVGFVLGLALRPMMTRGMHMFLLFQVLQGGLAFVFAKFLFGLPLQESLAYPAGALMAYIALWMVRDRTVSNFQTLILGAFLAGGLALALRLGGIPGGLAYGLAVLNSYFPGTKILSDATEAQGLWKRALFLTALLAVGRAAIQYYLVQSNYAHLGIVITHPYSYVALVAGLVLPFLAVSCGREKILSPALWVPWLGILLPLALGIFLHARPMAGFLLGLVTAVFLAGLLYEEIIPLGLLHNLCIGSAVLALPLFRKFSDLSRVIRLEILAGLLVLAVLIYLGVQRSRSSRVET